MVKIIGFTKDWPRVRLCSTIHTRSRITHLLSSTGAGRPLALTGCGVGFAGKNLVTQLYILSFTTCGAMQIFSIGKHFELI